MDTCSRTSLSQKNMISQLKGFNFPGEYKVLETRKVSVCYKPKNSWLLPFAYSCSWATMLHSYKHISSEISTTKFSGTAYFQVSVPRIISLGRICNYQWSAVPKWFVAEAQGKD